MRRFGAAIVLFLIFVSYAYAQTMLGYVPLNKAGDTATGQLNMVPTGTVSNGASATTFCVYNTVDSIASPTNYERACIDWSLTANAATLDTTKGGSGTARDVGIVPGSGTVNIGKSGSANSIALQLYGATGGSGSRAFTIFDLGTPQLAIGSNGYVAFGNGDAAGSNITSIGPAASKVVQIGDGSNNANGWYQFAGEARLDADFSCSNVAGCTNGTTLTNVTGSSHSLTVSLQASRNYIFEISLPMVTGASSGGIKIGLGGSATVTNLIADGLCVDSTTNIAVTRVSSLTQMVANTNAGTTPKCTFWGTFEVANAGTFTVQFAQNAGTSTNSTVKRGAYMFVHDAP